MGLTSHVRSLHPFCYHPRPPFPQIEDHNSLQLHTLPPALPLQSVPTQTPAFWRADTCAFAGPSPLPGPCPGSAPLPVLRGSAPGPPRVPQPRGSGEDMGGQGRRRELRPRTTQPSRGVAKRHHGQSKRAVGGVTGPQVTGSGQGLAECPRWKGQAGLPRTSSNTRGKRSGTRGSEAARGKEIRLGPSTYPKPYPSSQQTLPRSPVT